MSDLVKILTLIVVVAIVAVLVSRQSQTVALINNISTVFSSVIRSAVAPVA